MWCVCIGSDSKSAEDSRSRETEGGHGHTITRGWSEDMPGGMYTLVPVYCHFTQWIQYAV